MSENARPVLSWKRFDAALETVASKHAIPNVYSLQNTEEASPSAVLTVGRLFFSLLLLFVWKKKKLNLEK